MNGRGTSARGALLGAMASLVLAAACGAPAVTPKGVDSPTATPTTSTTPATTPSATPTQPLAPSTVQICPGIVADVAGVDPASDALQACVNAASAGSTLEIPPGVYRMTGALVIDKPLTLRTAGAAANTQACFSPTGPACAILRADANLIVPRGFVRLESAAGGVVLEHIAIDGNRAQRLGSAAAASCAAGDTGFGFNAATPGCEGCSFLLSASVNALCGSGFEWIGDHATIEGSLFQGNGDHATRMMWSDGLTLLHSDGAVVAFNQFLDDSDVGLILGGAARAQVHDNLVAQLTQSAFAGLMLDNFNGTATGDFTGAVISANTVQCGSQRCDFGIELGPHAWYLSPNLIGGTIQGNAVSGAKLGINAEGAGTAASPTVVSGNDAGSSPASATFLCGAHASTAFNVSPDSVVDLQGGPLPSASFVFHECP